MRLEAGDIVEFLAVENVVLDVLDHPGFALVLTPGIVARAGADAEPGAGGIPAKRALNRNPGTAPRCPTPWSSHSRIPLVDHRNMETLHRVCAPTPP